MKPISTLYKKITLKSPSGSKLYLDMRLKFTLTFLTIILLLYAVFFITFQKSDSAIKNNIYPLVFENIKQSSSGLDLYLKQVETVSKLIIQNPQLKSLTESANPSTFNIKDISSVLSIANDFNNTIQGIFILDGSHIVTLYNHKNQVVSIPDASSNSWYADVQKKDGNIAIIGTNQRFDTKGNCNHVFSTAAKLQSPKSSENSKVLLIDFDFNVLCQIAKAAYGNYAGSMFYLLNQENIIMYSTDGSSLSTVPDSSILNSIAASASGSKNTFIDDKEYHLVYHHALYSQWVLVNAIPVKILFKDMEKARNFYMIAAVICLPVFIIISFFTASLFLKPVNKLIFALAKQEKDDDNVKISFGTGTDKNNTEGKEMSIDNLTDKIYYTQMKQKEAQLNSLQNQINPHFLYNTLESIRGAALYHKAPIIASMAKCLSLFFRYSISDNILVTLSEEIKHLDNYIAIQNFRHDDKFSVLYNIPENLYDYKILKLSLQPLVENSIKHGLEMKIGKGIIRISVITLGDAIRIEVWDDGLGIPETKVDELNRILSQNLYSKDLDPLETNSSGTGIGVRNVNSRIKLYFGQQYGVKFLPTSQGATVELTLPIISDNTQGNL